MTRVFVFEYLTGGGAIDAGAEELMPQGRRMRDALVADLLRTDGCRVSAAVCAQAPLAADGAVPVRARSGDSVFDFVAREAAQHDLAWVVAPETQGLLARFAGVVGAGRWLGCDRRAIDLCASKAATLRRLRDAGVDTPLGFAGQGGVPPQWVVKPDDGAGCIDTRRHASWAAAEADARARSGPTAVERWVDGEPLSLSLLCRDSGPELLSVNRQRIGVGADGRLFYGGLDVGVIPPGSARGEVLAALAGRVAQAIPGLRGFVGIDLVWHPGGTGHPVVIEVNPRVTCAYEGLWATPGRHLAAELVSMFTPEIADAEV